MKRIYMTLGLVGALATSVIAQSSDLEPLIFTPTDGQTLVIDSVNLEETYLNYAFINHGPNDLSAGDTIIYADPFGAKGVILNNNIPMGDTIFIATDTVNISGGPESGPMDWCVEFVNFGLDTLNPAIQDPNPGNDQTCVSVMIDNRNTVGITDLFKNDNKSLSIYPNPVQNGVLNIQYEFETTTEAAVNVMDITGRLLITENLNSKAGTQIHAVNVSNLPAGNYIVELTSDEGRAVSKFTIK